MGSELRVAVAGATGALGGEIVKVLDQVSWRPAQLMALARQTTSQSHVDYGDERVPVDVLSDVGYDGADVLFLATPASAARAVAETAAQRGVLTIDCTGALADEPTVPLIVPWVNPEALAGVAGLVAVPDSAAVMLASALGPLRRAGINGQARAVVMVPASHEGKAGIEELSRQVVALFNSGTPPRKVFPNGLAFDLLPAIGTLGADDGWTSQERRTAHQVTRVAELDQPLDVTLVGVPVVSGFSAHLTIDVSRAAPPELVLRILADGGARVPEAPGVRYLPRPRRVEGTPFVHVARVRVGADGRSIHLWLSMDNLRTTATAAVAIAGALTRPVATD
ncbi:MAG: Asd/ArgC dimerization domain-containing protein [Myxococcota bacterium]